MPPKVECEPIITFDPPKEEKNDDMPKFWRKIRKIGWQDGDNKNCVPRDDILETVRKLTDELAAKLTEAKMCPDYDDKEMKILASHIVGLGQIVYDGVIADPQFAAAFAGSEQDFLGFLS